ncbi:hypothetical protein H4219_004686 [Mycoemilia scoparia]|uniref:Pre-mRNA-splicing factor 38 n=1 Tax=Mycoemilia scoparia TaxID=417184 RepID=A0A9W7ZWH1_9FUNG|nr:hypothetical protein H4219_004686 [Mycoemilia scoparia]
MPDGSFMLICMDEFIEQLLSPNHDNRVCGIVMPIIPRRITLEDNGELLPRVSQLEKKKKESDTDTSSDDDSDSSSNDD